MKPYSIHKFLIGAMMVLTLFIVLLVITKAQTLTPAGPASIRAGASAPVRVMYTEAATPLPIAALQWEITASAGTLSAPITGPQIEAAGKKLDCNPPKCVVTGLNFLPIASGEVASFTLTVPAAQPAGPLTISLTSPISASPAAVNVPVAAGPPISIAVVIFDPGDLNTDGKVDAVDLQIAVDQILGRAPCGSADLDKNGKCEVRDAQELANRRTVP